MNFKILKDIIAEFKKKLRCIHCNKSISNKELSVTVPCDEIVFFTCQCSKCNNKFYAEITLKDKKLKRQHRALNKPIHTNITSDDVLDCKNFLKSFKGDFKQIFKK